jgi:Family of unknown function (DUF6152)
MYLELGSCGSVLESGRRIFSMKALLAAGSVIVALVSGAAPLWAHHSWPVDMSKLVTVKGTVTEFAWENPHPMITLEVRADDGKMEKWLVGGPAITRMEANGWTKTTVKPGDVLTGIGYQFTDGQKIIRLERVLLADGKEMRLYGR